MLFAINLSIRQIYDSVSKIISYGLCLQKNQ